MLDLDEPDVDETDGVDVARSLLRGERLEKVGDDPWKHGSHRARVRTLNLHEELREASLAKVAAVRDAGFHAEQVPRQLHDEIPLMER